MLALLVLIVALSVVVAMLLFGDSPTFRNTPIHSLHLVLVKANASAMRQVQSNAHIYSFLQWLVPLFYCVVVLFCLFEFFIWVYPALDSGVVDSHVHSAYIAFSIASVVFSTALVTLSDAGTVTPANVDSACSAYPNNGLIFFPKSCHTCCLLKPARSKHCSVCNKCVILYDHHCIWVNNCIGYKNFRWFMAFLVLNINMMVYGGYLCLRELRKQSAPNGWWKLIVATTESNRIAGILLILASIISVITFLFFCLHIRYLYLGVTTNEADKWGDIEHLVSLGMLYYIVEKNVYVEEASLRLMDGTFEVVYILLNDDGETRYTVQDKERYTFLKISLMETDLDNIYDHGFFNNFKERVFI